MNLLVSSHVWRSSKEATKSIADTYPILKKPFLRGCVALYESLVIGMKALSFSAKAAGDEEEEMSNSEIAITMVISTLFAIAVFFGIAYIYRKIHSWCTG